MGPKKFKTWILCLGLVVKQVYRLSYCRTMCFLVDYFDISMHWTTLQKAAKRLPKHFWQNLLASTVIVDAVPLAAADGTGFSRSGPSHHFLKRIDREGPVGRPVQAIAMIDVQQRKFIAANFFAKPHHEVKKIPALHRQSCVKPKVLLLDKAGDSEKLHQWLNENGTFLIAPARKNCRRGKHRKLMRDCMDWWLYWQRNIVKCLFSALKRKFGNTISSRHIKTINAEMFCRLIAYNIGYKTTEIFYRTIMIRRFMKITYKNISKVICSNLRFT